MSEEDSCEELFVVEKILDFRKHEGQRQYLVQWHGYGPEENTWEPEHGLSQAVALLVDFWRKKAKADKEQLTKDKEELTKDKEELTSKGKKMQSEMEALKEKLKLLEGEK